MRILFFPGLSSPYCDKYRPVYDPLIQEAARRFPHAGVKCLSFPGQTDEFGDIASELLIPEAAAYARHYISSEAETDWIVIARSTGCNVAAFMMADWTSCPVRRAVFWGPPPFWLYWHMFVRHKDEHVAKAKATGVHISERIAQSATPFESLVPETACHLLTCAGTEDEHCPVTHLEYLKTIWQRRPHTDFAVVKNCPHTVTPETPGWDGYVQTIFGWITSTQSAVDLP